MTGIGGLPSRNETSPNSGMAVLILLISFFSFSSHFMRCNARTHGPVKRREVPTAVAQRLGPSSY